ncbi:HEAT repeat domain-containing protein [Fimbriiglobus ruber]|nr:HEAT repeat domain-containing protein [Fimbriiglobus ruber]
MAFILTVLVGLTAVPSAEAAGGLGIFKRKSNPDAAARVKDLIKILQSDPDATKRRAAAEELRGLDPRTNPEILTALVSTLKKDPAPEVRSEAAESIGKIKLVSQTAGIELETVLQTEPDAKVRDAVKSALWQYHLNGFRTTLGAPADTQSQTPEPPLAGGPGGRSTGEAGFRPITNAVGKGVNYQTTTEPPLAKPKVKPAPAAPATTTSTSMARPPAVVAAPSSLPQPMPSTLAPDAAPGVPTVAVPPLPTTPSSQPVPNVQIPSTTPSVVPSTVPSVSVPSGIPSVVVPPIGTPAPTLPTAPVSPQSTEKPNF